MSEPMPGVRRPWSCRLGFHQWYSDGALFASADRCDKCSTWKNAAEGAAVERARAAIMRDPEGMFRAAQNLYASDEGRS